MSVEGKVLCQQCNDEFPRDDVKQIYGEDLDICGYICNPCCIKSVEYARRCQIVDCKTRPDSGPTGFRTLPSKFYDLPEGEVKKRIIKQFGIIRTVRACCNMCYNRISKGIIQTQIVYGDGLQSKGKWSPGKTSKYQTVSTSQNQVEGTKGPQAKEDRLAVYTGPKFTRRSGGAPCWNKNKVQTECSATPTNVCTMIEKDREKIIEETKSASLDDKQGQAKLTAEDSPQSPGTEPKILDEKVSDTKGKDEASTSAGTISRNNGNEIRDDTVVDKEDTNRNDKMDKSEAVSYSSTPISPTSMRFRRIQPKMPKFEEFDLSDDLLDLAEFSPPGSRGNHKRLRGVEDDDVTWSPGKTKRERTDSRGSNNKRPVSNNVMSDFVSCTGCRKICSSKEAQLVLDEKKGRNVRLCSDCCQKKKEESARCPMKGCSNTEKNVILKSLPATAFELQGKAKLQLDEIGVSKDTKFCCERCLNTIKNIITTGMKEKGKHDKEGDEQVLTICRKCRQIVPMKKTVPNFEDDGRKCGVLCLPCNRKGDKDCLPAREEPKTQKKKIYDTSSMKTLGFCTAKGCIHAGKIEPVPLVSGKKILRNYLDEKMLRAEFDLDDDTDYCCRSCHARIKWFVADIKKKERGVGADGKMVNSLKNLTPRIKVEDVESKEESKAMLARKLKNHIDRVNGNEESKQFQKGNYERLRIKKQPVNDSVDANQTFSSKILRSQQSTEDEKTFLTEYLSEDLSQQTDGFPDQNVVIIPTQSNLTSKPTILIPPTNTPASSISGHPPFLQVGRQQFVLNVISRCEKETQTYGSFATANIKSESGFSERGVQANIPLMPKFEGTVPANLPNGKKVKYVDAKEKTKYAVKRAGKDLFDQFLQQLDDISGGCSQQLFADIYRPKDSVMASNYEKILSSIGMLYKKTERANRQERLRLLSTVALHASNETLKRFFQRTSKKGDLVSVNEGEIVQAREYAKQFGPGVHVMPVGALSWKTLVLNELIAASDEEEPTEIEAERKCEQQKHEKVESGAEEDRTFMEDNDKNALGRSNEGKDSPSGRMSPDIPVIGKEGDKKLITLEKMNQIEEGLSDKKSGQFVTFKVTVRQAKEKGCADAVEHKSYSSEAKDNAKEALKRKDDALPSEAESTESEASKRSHEIQKSGKAEKKAGKRKGRASTGCISNDGGKDSLRNQPKKRRRSNFVQGSKTVDKEGEIREKRRRTAFNNERKIVLEKYFDQNIYATKTMVEEISKELSIDKKKIENWFRNRRSKLKKDEEERSRRDVVLKERKDGRKKVENNNSVNSKDTSTVPSSKKLTPSKAGKNDKTVNSAAKSGGTAQESKNAVKDNDVTTETDASASKDLNIKSSVADPIVQNDSNTLDSHAGGKSPEYVKPNDVSVVSQTESKSMEHSKIKLNTVVKDSGENIPACEPANTVQSVFSPKAKDTLSRNESSNDASEVDRGDLSRDNLNGADLNRDDVSRDDINRDDINRDDKNRDDINRDDINRDDKNRDDMNRDDLNRDDINRDDINRDDINRDDINRDDLNRDDLNRDDLKRDALNRDDLNRDKSNDLEHEPEFNLNEDKTEDLMHSKSLDLSNNTPDISMHDATDLNQVVPRDLTHGFSRESTPILPVKTTNKLPIDSTRDQHVLQGTKGCQKLDVYIPQVPKPGVEEAFVKKGSTVVENRFPVGSIWPSVDDVSAFAVRSMDGYADAVADDVSNVPEDLALALNSDPDFMKDLNELMDIAKT